MSEALTVLAVDDEAPALDELVFMLQKHPPSAGCAPRPTPLRAARVARRRLRCGVPRHQHARAVRIELAAVLSNFAQPPAVVFVTAHDDKAVAAFDVGAVDYLLKPIRSDRLDAAVRRVTATRSAEPAGRARRPCPGSRRDSSGVGRGHAADPTGRHRMGGSRGDYSRLHSESGAHLVRIPLSTLETRWADAGFQRVHRSYLVSLSMVTGMRTTGGSAMVRLRANGASPAVELPVSRRQVRELRDRLIRYPMRGYRSVRGDE
jgi:DNA-binding LytR/AlgR family response regulator